MATTAPKSWDQILGEGSTVEIEGKTYDIKPLTIGDWSQFENWVRAKMLAQLRANATALALRPIDKAKAVAELLQRPFGDTEIVEHANTPAGAKWVLERALQNAGTKGVDVDKLHHIDRANKAAFVLQLSGILHWPAWAEDNKEDDDSDPTPLSGQDTGAESTLPS